MLRMERNGSRLLALPSSQSCLSSTQPKTAAANTTAANTAKTINNKTIINHKRAHVDAGLLYDLVELGFVVVASNEGHVLAGQSAVRQRQPVGQHLGRVCVWGGDWGDWGGDVGFVGIARFKHWDRIKAGMGGLHSWLVRRATRSRLQRGGGGGVAVHVWGGG